MRSPEKKKVKIRNPSHRVRKVLSEFRTRNLTITFVTVQLACSVAKMTLP
jgi:hypothetical protein